MKVRNGFVSNSSSSSFIIGLLNNKKGLGNFIFNPPCLENNYDGEEIPWGLKYSKNKNEDTYTVSIESFNGNTVKITAKLGDNITFLDGVGPDGDEDFSIYDSNGNWSYMDYDLELEDFEEKDISIYNDINENGGDTSFGAGRNG